jgi:hypothetical protein
MISGWTVDDASSVFLAATTPSTLDLSARQRRHGLSNRGALIAGSRFIQEMTGNASF